MQNPLGIRIVMTTLSYEHLELKDPISIKLAVLLLDSGWQSIFIPVNGCMRVVCLAFLKQ